MSLSFSDGWVEPVQFADWPLQGTPRFATSRAYEIFLRELRRYTLEEVSGRSFLIAGHRGAGKTALVTRAIEAIRTERIRMSVQSDVNSVSRRGRLQRPLLVKLAAQSLIAAPLVLAPAKPEKADDDEDADANGARKQPKEGGSEDARAAAPTPHDPVAGALVHLTIALYRALAQEVAQGFAFHAASPDEANKPDRQELAAQLLLDLDDAPEPSLLRRKWEQLGRCRAACCGRDPQPRRSRQPRSTTRDCARSWRWRPQLRHSRSSPETSPTRPRRATPPRATTRASPSST